MAGDPLERVFNDAVLIAVAAALGTTLCSALLLPVRQLRLDRRTWLLASLASALAGGVIGFAAGTELWSIHSSIRSVIGAAIGAGSVFGLLNLGRTPRSRRVIALAALPCLAVAVVGLAALVPGALPGWGSAPQTGRNHPLAWAPEPVQSDAGYRGIARWRIPAISAGAIRTSAAATSRTTGEVGSVHIPASRSHFRARPAIVYLPPAALTAHPVRLPVVIALSGQSRKAGPNDVFAGGRMAAIMNGIARKHDGVAPVVVVPDQLGAGPKNPMCVDSSLGDVATYLTVDVRHWILTHLPVAADRKDWTIAGFSEGGTCAIQLGAERPDLFGSLVDVSGERAPINGTLAHTIAAGFGGSAAAYAAASPLSLLATHRYPATMGYFAVGALDTHYRSVAPVMAQQARRSGMTVHLARLPNLHHNWLTGSAGLSWGLTSLTDYWPAEAAAARRRAEAPATP